MTTSFQSVAEGSIPLEPEAIRAYIKERIEFERKLAVPSDLQSTLVRQAKISAYLKVRLGLLGIPFDAADDAPLGEFSYALIDPFGPNESGSIFGNGPITTKSKAPQVWINGALQQPGADYDFDAESGRIAFHWENTLCRNDGKKTRQPSWIKSIHLSLTRLLKRNNPR